MAGDCGRQGEEGDHQHDPDNAHEEYDGEGGEHQKDQDVGFNIEAAEPCEFFIEAHRFELRVKTQREHKHHRVERRHHPQLPASDQQDISEEIAHQVFVVAGCDGDEEDPDRHADCPYRPDDRVFPFTYAEAHDADNQRCGHSRYDRALGGRDRPPVDHLQPASDSQAGEHAVGDCAGNIGDASYHHVGTNYAAGDAGERTRYQRVLEKLEFEDGSEELHQWSIR